MNRPGAPDAPDASPASVPDGPARRGPRAGRIALFAVGLGVLAAILARVGWGAVVDNLARIGPWFPSLVVLYAVAQLSFAAGWWVLTGPRGGRVPFGALFAAYLGGDSVNYFTSVGGEPVKAQLVRERLGFSHGLATVAVHRHADVLAQWIFLTLGVGVALVRFDLPAVARIASAARRLDERIGAFYRERTDHFGLAVAWCLLGWCGGLVETYLVLRLLSPAADWSTAVAIESLAMVLNNILLFIPGRVGSAEGVRIGVYALVGLSAAQGTAYALVRRGRELLWLVPGVVVLLKRHVLDGGRLRLPEVPAAEPEHPATAESRA